MTSTWTLGSLVFVLTWGGGGAALAGLDPSWQAGLNLALDEGIEHGDALVFSYGPLGFLKSNLLFFPWPARLAALYGIATHLALSLSLVWAARRSLPLPVAVALALVAAALIRGDAGGIFFKADATVPVLAFIWCVAALDERRSELARKLVVYAGAPTAAIEVLGKLNTGVVVLAMLTLTVIAIGPHRRDILAFFASFLASLAALWLAAGQSAGSAGEYVGGGIEIVSGYVSAMVASGPGRAEDAVLAPAVVAVAFGIGWVSTRGLAHWRRAAILVLLAALVFSAFKAGFVRHTVFQVAVFYATVVGACLAFRLPAQPAARFFGGLAVAGVAAAAWFSTTTSGFLEYPMADPIENVSNGFSTVRTLVEPGRAAEEVAESGTRVAAGYGLDPRTLELLRDAPVHVDPWEAEVAWAHGLEWRPLPVFQTYAAYTEELDRRNAEALASDDGPSRILRQHVAFVGERYPGSIQD
ncbi:MAG: hypothetical protein ACRDL3_08710, partial [Solirubrobacterales bacterium]